MDSIEDSYYLAKGVFNEFFHGLNVEKQLSFAYHSLPKIDRFAYVLR